MELLISRQLIEAAASIALGLAAGFFYDILRVIRRRADSRIVTWAADLLFWIVTAPALFIVGFTAGAGHQRVYMTALSILSAGLYFGMFSRACMHLAAKVVDFFVLIIKIVTYPLGLILMILKKIAKIIKKTFQYWQKWYTIDWEFVLPSEKAEPPGKAKRGTVNETQTRRYYYEDTGPGASGLRRSKSYRPMAADGGSEKYTKRNNRRNRRAGKS